MCGGPCHVSSREESVMGNPRSGSFSTGRGPRSTTWGTWLQASLPPGWTGTPCDYIGQFSSEEPSLSAGGSVNTMGWYQGRVGQGILLSTTNHQELRRLNLTELALWRWSFFRQHLVSPPPVHLAKIYSRNTKGSNYQDSYKTAPCRGKGGSAE